MDQLALTACVVLGIVFGFAVAKYLAKGAMTALEARVKAESQREAVALGERVAAKEARLVELTRDNLDAKRRLEDALDHAARLNGAQQQFDTQLAELKRQAEEKVTLVTRSHERALEALRAAHEEKAEQAEKDAVELAARAENAKEEAEALRDEVAALRAEQAETEARIAAADDAQANLEQTLRAISAETFQQGNQAFMDLARATFEKVQDSPRGEVGLKQQSLDEAVRPLRDGLARIAGAIAGMERDRVAALTGLSDQVASLLAAQQQIQSDTQGLAAALAAPSPRGSWGELQLRRVVELAGMIEHCDFEPAGSPAALVIHLPSQRLIAVDAGVPLTAFSEAAEAPEKVRIAKLREHAAAVRQHIANLASPEYWSLFEEKPELVVAFLPGEAPFGAALEHDAALLEFGAAQNVVLATPATLIALLRAAAHGWKQHQLTETAREINALGQSLFESLREYQERMDDFRGNLERTVESYNTAAGTFETRVLGPVRRFQTIAPPAQVELRPRAIPALATRSIPGAVAALAAASASEPDIETALFDTGTDPFDPAADEPAPISAFDDEAGFGVETAFDDEFDFEEEALEIELVAEPEPTALTELEPVIAEEPEPVAQAEIEAPVAAVERPGPAEAVAPAPVMAQPSEAAGPIAEPIDAAPAQPLFSSPLDVESHSKPPVMEDLEPESEPEPELVPLAFAESSAPEIEIDEPSFPEFSPNLAAMANSVGRTSATLAPAAQAPALQTSDARTNSAGSPAAAADPGAAQSNASGTATAEPGEGSGYFSAFVKI